MTLWLLALATHIIEVEGKNLNYASAIENLRKGTHISNNNANNYNNPCDLIKSWISRDNKIPEVNCLCEASIKIWHGKYIKQHIKFSNKSRNETQTEMTKFPLNQQRRRRRRRRSLNSLRLKWFNLIFAEMTLVVIVYFGFISSSSVVGYVFECKLHHAVIMCAYRVVHV